MRRLITYLDGRWGGKPIPSRLGNVPDPWLRAFVELFDEIMHENETNRPLGIHIMTMGFAGFITAYGDFNFGFLGSIVARDGDHNTNVADSIFLVPVVKPSIIKGAPDSVKPGRALNWTQHLNKCLRKYRLVDVVRRDQYRQYVNTYNEHNPGAPMQVMQSTSRSRWRDQRGEDVRVVNVECGEHLGVDGEDLLVSFDRDLQEGVFEKAVLYCMAILRLWWW